MTDAPSTGQKFDAGKPRPELIPPSAITAAAQVFAFGAEKYDDRNWELGISYGRLYGALQRHLNAFWNGEQLDPESGEPHTAHALCCLMMLHEHAVNHRYAEWDDRPDTTGDRPEPEPCVPPAYCACCGETQCIRPDRWQQAFGSLRPVAQVVDTCTESGDPDSKCDCWSDADDGCNACSSEECESDDEPSEPPPLTAPVVDFPSLKRAVANVRPVVRKVRLSMERSTLKASLARIDREIRECEDEIFANRAGAASEHDQRFADGGMVQPTRTIATDPGEPVQVGPHQYVAAGVDPKYRVHRDPDQVDTMPRPRHD